jgi:hypothetical protein
MVSIIVNSIISNEYRFSDLKLNLSLIQNINEATGKMKIKANKGSHNISNIAPTTAK